MDGRSQARLTRARHSAPDRVTRRLTYKNPSSRCLLLFSLPSSSSSAPVARPSLLPLSIFRGFLISPRTPGCGFPPRVLSLYVFTLYFPDKKTYITHVYTHIFTSLETRVH